MPQGGVRNGKKKKTKVGQGLFQQCKKEKIGRRPIGQYVGDFCSVPRGGVKGKWKIGRGPIGRCVGRVHLVPQGGARGKRQKQRFGRGPFVQQVWDFILFSLSLEVA